MWDQESTQIRQQQKFMQDVEHAISDINRQVISARIPNLNREKFVAFAGHVAQLRADYLHSALELTGTHDSRTVALLAEKRVAFEEARAAFAALERAIERGYVDIA